MAGPRKVKMATKREQDSNMQNMRKIAEAVVDAVKKDNTAPISEPGAIINGRKIPWTKRDMDLRFDKVTFTPEETRAGNNAIIWNGLIYEFFADVPATLPTPVKELYDTKRKEERKALSRNLIGGAMRIGVGGLEPESQESTPVTA